MPIDVVMRRVNATPLARRIATEGGIDLKSLVGTGPRGRIVRDDVAKAIDAAREPSSTEAPPSKNLPDVGKGATQVVALTRLQQTVSRRMADAKATVPHFYVQTEIDMGSCVEFRRQIKLAGGEHEVVPSVNDMVVKACAIALREFPRANASYRDGTFELHSRVNVGIAVAAKDALIVPTIFDADTKGLRQIADESRELAARVRSGEVTPPELAGGTFTVSNLGMYGVSSFHPVVNPPQAGILGVGAVVERPVVRDREIEIAAMMSVTLACDHRILYGADGAELLSRIRALLEQPLSLAL